MTISEEMGALVTDLYLRRDKKYERHPNLAASRLEGLRLTAHTQRDQAVAERDAALAERDRCNVGYQLQYDALGEYQARLVEGERRIARLVAFATRLADDHLPAMSVMRLLEPGDLYLDPLDPPAATDGGAT